jgi:hypothetical protein
MKKNQVKSLVINGPGFAATESSIGFWGVEIIHDRSAVLVVVSHKFEAVPGH